MKKKWCIRAVFIAGFLLCCLPIANNVMEQRYQKDAIATYQKAVGGGEEKGIKEAIKEAQEYNDMLFQTDGAVVDDSDTQILSDESYESQLDISGSGVMGSIDIPKINVELPIYHGTEEKILSNGIGHLQGTSLPIGGANTHCVLTGHRGLPSSKLLVRLDEMKKDDLFFIRGVDGTLAYKVCDIQTVTPEDVSSLKIKPEQDLVSIITCTPYGINTHRLIVTGKRVDYKKSLQEGIKKELPSIRELMFTALPFVFFIVAVGLSIYNRKWRRITDEDNEKI